MPPSDVFWRSLQEFVIYITTGIDISLIVAYPHVLNDMSSVQFVECFITLHIAFFNLFKAVYNVI